MKLKKLVALATDKDQFLTVSNYVSFCERYLDFVETGLQARIISQNETNYQFFQYREEGSFNITRPLNSNLMYDAADFQDAANQFLVILEQLRTGEQPPNELRENVVRTIYTVQQSIGAAFV